MKGLGVRWCRRGVGMGSELRYCVGGSVGSIFFRYFFSSPREGGSAERFGEEVRTRMLVLLGWWEVMGIWYVVA